MYTLHNTLKISDLRKHTAEVVEEIEKGDKPVMVFSRSQPKIVIMSFSLYRQKEKQESSSANKTGIDMFIDPPEEMLIKKKGIDAVKEIRALR
ncbi:type II toxin-antitoxin system Phd/YefM family antitoxin [Candidatus Peregrinibacteria bacterium]|nr:type II toxin-antitoxin system Phd/YefM family antitoxin [Candidatus Peregrinibacteria bacterium]